LARSACSSSSWLSARPVTAAHNDPDSRSRIEVSSRNARSGSGWRSSTSAVRKSSTYRWLPENPATKASTSRRPCSDSAASCNPAAHPSVRFSSATTAASGSFGVGLLGVIGVVVALVLVVLATVLVAVVLGLLGLGFLTGLTVAGGLLAAAILAFLFVLAVAFAAPATVGLALGRLLSAATAARSPAGSARWPSACW
jgi:hypothetical protein